MRVGPVREPHVGTATPWTQPAQRDVTTSLLGTEIKSWGLSRWWPKPVISWESPGSLRYQTSRGRDLQEQESLGRHHGTPEGLTPVVTPVSSPSGSWVCFLRIVPRVWSQCSPGLTAPACFCAPKGSAQARSPPSQALEPSLSAPGLPRGPCPRACVWLGQVCVLAVRCR